MVESSSSEVWILNERSGIFHVIAIQGVTACGIKFKSGSGSKYVECHEPGERLCKVCLSSRDWFVRKVIIEDV